MALGRDGTTLCNVNKHSDFAPALLLSSIGYFSCKVFRIFLNFILSILLVNFVTKECGIVNIMNIDLDGDGVRTVCVSLVFFGVVIIASILIFRAKCSNVRHEEWTGTSEFVEKSQLVTVPNYLLNEFKSIGSKVKTGRTKTQRFCRTCVAMAPNKFGIQVGTVKI